MGTLIAVKGGKSPPSFRRCTPVELCKQARVRLADTTTLLPPFASPLPPSAGLRPATPRPRPAFVPSASVPETRSQAPALRLCSGTSVPGTRSLRLRPRTSVPSSSPASKADTVRAGDVGPGSEANTAAAQDAGLASEAARAYPRRAGDGKFLMSKFCLNPFLFGAAGNYSIFLSKLYDSRVLGAVIVSR
jgi:hypothetical protein